MAEPARPWDAGPGRAAAGGGVGAAGSVSPGPSSERSEARSDEGVLAARDDGDEAARARRDQAIYYLDAVERQLEGLRRRLSRLQQSRTAQAHELATALAQVGFLERAAEHVEDVGRHEVVVELVAVGGRSFPGAGLLGAMVKGYRLERTEVEGFASARKAGPIAHQAVEHAANGADAVVLRVGGLDVLSLLEGEAGYHAWESLAGSVELVRVAVRPATDADDDGALVRAAVALAAAGAERPDDAVAPLVRQVSFDPRSDRKTTAPAEVTDHRLELATVMAVHDYDEIVARCVALRAGRGTSAGDGREGAR